MPKTMLIKAKPGLRIPLPESSYRYVEGDKPVAVDVDTFERRAYWTRRVEHGECTKVEAAAASELGTTTRLEVRKSETPPPSPFAVPPPAVTPEKEGA